MNQPIELLSKKHKKKEFACGKEILDHYLRYQAGQDVKRKLSACFVWEDRETGLIRGYYTLSNNHIPLSSLPLKWKKKLPLSYTSIPVTLLGRLAVDTRFRGQGTGSLLLVDALKRSYEVSEMIGSFGVVVDPLDEEAERFYALFGFLKLPDSGKMFMAMQTIKALITEL